MTKFLTVKEAAHLTGKSPSSIRRLIYPILDNPKHADRHHIEPDVATAKALRIKGENFAWKVSEELLRREIPEGESKAGPEPKSKSHGGIDQSAAIVEILRKQLDIKDQQIVALNEHLKEMSSRLREGNILMGSLQQQLGPAKPANQNPTDAVVTDPPPSSPEQGSGKAEPHGPIRRILHWKIF
jgi:hypothetical protein